jgi:hypothetical protein
MAEAAAEPADGRVAELEETLRHAADACRAGDMASHVFEETVITS